MPAFRKPTRFVVPLMALLLGLIGCSKNSETQDANPTQTLRVAIGASPQSLDPHLITGVPAMKITAALFEPLLVLNTVTEQPEPGVATKWAVSDNGLHYRFELRKNAKWSDGTPVTAKDFVFTWRRILAPGIAAPYAQEYYAISGAEAYHKGKVRDFSTVGVKATAPDVVEFTLKEPDPLFLKRMAQDSTVPVQEAAVTYYTAFDDPVSEWTQPPHLVSNGPFILTQWELNKSIVAVKNPHYWDAENVKLDKIIFIPADSQATTERMFRSNQLDFDYGGTIPAEKIATYKQDAPEKLVIQPGYATYYYSINTRKPPFDNLNVRRALAFAVDRDMIVQRITKAGQKPAYTVSPIDDSYHPSSALSFNPDKAREYLAKAGYPNGENFPPITISYNTNENHRKVAIAIQQMWKDTLNIDVELVNQEWKVFLATRYSHDYEVCRDAAASTYPDPADMLTVFATGHDMNTPNWSNSDYDALIARARVETNNETRLALLAQAEELLLEQMPVIPIYYYAYSYLISPEVHGMTFSRVERPDFKSIYIEPSKQRQ